MNDTELLIRAAVDKPATEAAYLAACSPEAIKELLKTLDEARDELAGLRGTPGRGWKCFHCDERFTKWSEARDHFGVTLALDGPKCQVSDAEWRLMQSRLLAYQNEDSEKDREMAGMQSDHARALINEEEKGYARGLRDGRAMPREGFVAVPMRLTPEMNEILMQPDWEWADLLAAAEAITEEQYAAGIDEPPATPDQLLSARRWKALLSCGRIRILGSAGVDWKTGALTRDGYVHFGAEFTTVSAQGFPTPPEAAVIITAFADAAIAAQPPACSMCKDTGLVAGHQDERIPCDCDFGARQ
jgi:hypothetical protein